MYVFVPLFLLTDAKGNQSLLGGRMGLMTETFLKRQWIFSLRAVPFPLRRKPLACSDGLLTQGQLWNDFVCLFLIWEVTEKSRLQPLASRNVFLNSQADSQIRRSLCS